MDLEEKTFACPYCWQIISVELDCSVSAQKFIEDCQVCCRPIEIRYAVEEGEVVEFDYERAQ